MSEKEVYFNEYCNRCIYYSTAESMDPCDECLSQPVNEDSHKPLYFKKTSRKRQKSRHKTNLCNS